MIKRAITYLEKEPWDEEMIRQDQRRLKAVCWGVLIFAAIYFGWVILGMLTR